MFVFFYNTFIRLYIFLAKLISPFNAKSKQFIICRKDWYKKYSFLRKKENIIWIHCASLGEYELSIPIIKRLKEKLPNAYILVSFFSPSGYIYKKEIQEVDFYAYIPFDLPVEMKKWVDLTNPKLVLFAKYELWYNCISTLVDKNIPIVVFSASFRENQIYFKTYAFPYLTKLKAINHYFVVDDQSAHVLNKHKIYNVTVNGDTRFEKVYSNFISFKKMPEIEEFLDGQACMILGSAWIQDVEFVSGIVNNRAFPLKVIVAPHDIQDQNISRIKKYFLREVVMYSKISKVCSSCADVLIIDCIGVLTNLYGYGKIAFVGGAFKQGLHNILEPLAFGLPVFFGPKFQKYPEALMAIKKGVGFSVNNTNDFQKKMEELIHNADYYAKVSEIAQKWIQENKNTSQKISNYCIQLLNIY